MSRIHDALRRGRVPATSPAPPRSAHADAVLGALGYPSEKPAVRRPVLLTLVLIAVVIAAAWASWPILSRFQDRGARVELRGAKNDGGGSGAAGRATSAEPLKAAPAIERPRSPAPPPATLPAVSVPAPKPQVLSPTAPVAPTVSARQAPRSPAPAGQNASGDRPLTLEPRHPGVPQRSGARGSPATARSAGSDAAPPRDDFQMALYYQRAGDFEQALLRYKAVLQRDEMNVEAHNNLGSLYLGRNLLEEAAREFQRVLAIDPGYAPARINLSATLYKLGRFDAAAAQAREAQRIDPRNGDALVNLALAQKASGQHGDAQGSLRRALELNPRHAIAHYNLARQYEESGEAVRALEHYRQFLQYAGSEQEPYAVEVRARILTLQARAIR